MPETRIVSTADIDGLGAHLTSRIPNALAVRRFDRQNDGHRVHQEDFAQALEIGPDHIYGNTGGSRVSHDGLLRLVADAAGLAAAEDYVRRLAFVVVSGNTDAHLKNWSFQWTDGIRPQLSPLYDQVATVSWEPFGWQSGHEPELALSIGRCRSLAQLNDGHVATLAERGGIPEARGWFADGLAQARAAWHAVATESPPAMRAAIPEHWRRVPILAQPGP